MSQMTVGTINPWTLPAVPMAHRKRLPKSPGIYFALANGEILYIGKSESSIKGRWAGHHRENDLSCVDGVTIAWLEVMPGEHDLAHLERSLISVFNPILNNGPVFSAPRNPGRRKGPKNWATQMSASGARLIFLEGMELFGLTGDWRYRVLFPGAWFPEHVAMWAIGPCADSIDPDDTPSAGIYAADQKQCRENLLGYINGAESLAMNRGVSLEETFNHIAFNYTPASPPAP